MNLKHLAAAGAASLLMAGAAHAQLGSSATPGAGVTPNQASPAPAQPGTTGLPSVDSTRPTGADAGRTNLPNGQVDQSATVNPPAGTTAGVASSTTTGTSTGVTTSSTTSSADVAGSNASVTTSTTTNGPVPDTPENRRKYGGPMSHAGKRTAAKGN